MDKAHLKKKAFHGFAWKFAERISAQLVSTIVSIILARILMPEDFSVVSIVAIFFAFCNIFISGGLNSALIQKKDADLEDYSTIFFVNMIFAAFLYVVMFFVAPWIAKLYHNEILTPVLRVMGLTFFINGFKAILSAYTSSHLQFKKFFYATIVGTIISAVVGIVMALNGFGAWSLVAQQMTNSLIDTIVLYFTTQFHLVFAFSFTKLKSLLNYGWKIMVASFIDVLYTKTLPLIVGLKYSNADLSYYSKGKHFPDVINTSISSTLSSVLFPVMVKVQDNTKEILNITRKYIKVSSYVIFPIMIGFFAVAENYVLVLLTEKWIKTVPYIRIFCIPCMFNVIQVGNLQAMKALGRSDITLKLEVIKKSAYFVIIFLFLFNTNSPEYLAMSSLGCTVVATLVNTYPNRKLIGYRYRLQFVDMFQNLTIAVLMGVVVMWMNYLEIAPFILLFLQIIVGVLVYVLLSIVTRNKNFYYVLQLVKPLVKKKSA
ncbi:MAG: lipopolysaccharide biosynthesis protein [Erysipelotrichaceae bacterium]|nr:lipopolysaccharide biosynthesis protein [Erysipelotrichaceae bacterium]